MSSYTEVETENQDCFALRCPDCNNVIKKRKDSFIPGGHMLICVLCNHVGSAVDLMDGTHREIGAKDHKTPDDFQGKAA